MIENTAKKAFQIIFFILTATTVSIQSCPTCIGRVTKTSPAFFKNIIYKDPSIKNDRSSIESIRKQLNAIQSITTQHSDQKIQS